MPTNRAQYRIKANSGRKYGLGAESDVSAAAALGLAQAKLALVSGQVVEAGSQSTGLDLAADGNVISHSDIADGMNLELKTATGVVRTLHIPQVSFIYKAAINDGSVNIAHADIQDLVAAYNTATGLVFLAVKGQFVSEG